MHIGRTLRSAGPARVLVVVPDPHLRGELASQLSLAGYVVTPAETGAAALGVLDDQRVDLVLFDLELPDLFALARERPAMPVRPPVLCLAAAELLGGLIPVLGTEVADFVVKPGRADDVLARVLVLLRDAAPADPEPVLCYGDLRLDEATCRAWRGDRPLEVTPAEFRLLRHQLLNAGRVLSKEQLARVVGSEPRSGRAGADNAVERLVSRLRQKVDGAGPALIHTRRGFGYVLEAPRELSHVSPASG